MSSKRSTDISRIRRSNANVGWFLLAAVVVSVLLCGIFARQTRSLFGLSTMMTHGGHAGMGMGAYGAPLSGERVAYGTGPDVYGDARYGSIVGDVALYSPDHGLSKSEQTCSLPYPAGACALDATKDHTGSLYGMALGDQNVYPGGFLGPAIFNSSGYAVGCADCPNGCGAGKQCRA